MYKTGIPTIITNGHFNKEKTLYEIKRSGAERIFLAINRELEYAFSSDESLKLLKELIAYYEGNGIETAVWIGEIFGHVPDMTKNEHGYETMRLIDKGDIGAFCPLGEKFKGDCASWLKKVAMCGAKMIMLDDDFRLGYRGGLGCCCDLHMKRFEEEIGEKVEISGLKEKIFTGGKNKYRTAWLKVQGDSMREFVLNIRKELDSVDKNIRFGRCCSLNALDSDGTDAIEMAYLMAGNTKPFLRLCGAPYWCYRDKFHKLGELCEYVRNMANYCADKGIEFFSEGDTWPRPRFATPASYLECFDTIMRADNKTDGILKYMLDYVSDADYETGYVDAMCNNKELYKKIEEMFSAKKAVGVRPYNVTHQIENAEYSLYEKDLLQKIQDGFFSYSCKFAVLNSLPVSYEKGGVNILFGENARYIPKEELRYGNIIDASASKILMERGIDTGIEMIDMSQSYTPDSFWSIQHFFVKSGIYTGNMGAVRLPVIKHNTGAEVLSRFVAGKESFDGLFRYENKNGDRFLILTFDASDVTNDVMGYFDSYALKDLLVENISWLGEPLPVYAAGNYPRLYMMVKKGGGKMSIGLWNLFEDRIDGAKIGLGFNAGNAKYINCKGNIENNNIILDTTIYPYEFAGIEVEIIPYQPTE